MFYFAPAQRRQQDNALSVISVLGTAAAHHRLLWIHPFADGNGRVAEPGNLSEEALGGFTEFFLKICLDQVAFMEILVQSDRLRTRIILWTEEEIRMGILPAKSGMVLEALLYRGKT